MKTSSEFLPEQATLRRRKRVREVKKRMRLKKFR
jgi:hypothetical protein